MSATATPTPPKTKKRLLADLATRHSRAEALKAKIDANDATEDEVDEYEAEVVACKAIKAEVETFRAPPDGSGNELTDLRIWMQTPATAPPPTAGVTVSGTGGAAAGAIKATESEFDKYMVAGPFKSLGHFMYVIKSSGAQPGLVRDGSLGDWNYRIQQHDAYVKSAMPEVKAATGMNEMFDSEGGALVPPQYSNRVWERMAESSENLLNLVDRTPVAGNGFSMGAWNDKSRTGDILYGGARAYWGQEGGQKTPSHPTTRMITWKLNKLYVLMFATDELLEDTTALESKLSRVAADCITYKVNQAIINGTGTGQPLGLLQSSARITVTAEGGQGAGTIVALNVSKMYSRRAPGSARRLVWLYNSDIEPQLDQLNFPVEGTNSIAANFVYMPPGGLRDAQEPRLKGRPMVETEHAPAPGTEGDLILWDPQSYGAIVKSTGIQNAVSMHLRFDYDETAFRWVFRMDGRPFWDDALTPANGSTKAPIVTLSSTRT